MKKLLYFVCFLFVVGCGEGNEPEPVVNGSWNLNTPAARQTFFEQVVADKTWRLSRFLFDDTTRFNREEVPLKDLYKSFPACRKDDRYTWNYEFGDVRIDFYNQDDRCDPQEPSFLERGLLLEFNDSLTVAPATFRNLIAVKKFLDIGEEFIGTGWSFYEMEWRVTSLTSDSINIRGRFTRRPGGVPPFSAQFVPIN